MESEGDRDGAGDRQRQERKEGRSYHDRRILTHIYFLQWYACESAPLSVSAVSEDVMVSLVDFAILGDVLAGLECGPTGASNVFSQDTAPIVFSSVCVSWLALH